MRLYISGSLHARAGFVIFCYGGNWLWSYHDVMTHPRILHNKVALDTGRAHDILQSESLTSAPADFQHLARTAVAYYQQHAAEHHIMLDSGAYTAHQLGKHIGVHDYTYFVRQHREQFTGGCIMLDVIGDYDATMENLRKMRQRGVRPIPVYHPTNTAIDVDRLRALCDNYRYIALGGIVGSSKPVAERWLERCWKVFDGYPGVKVHLLGMTSSWALLRYPFYSCDSAAAIMSALFGKIVKFDAAELHTIQTAGKAKHAAYANGSSALTMAILRRSIHNVQETRKYEKFVTDVWAGRGVTWAAGEDDRA